MLICGIKLSHDGCVALIQDNELIFNIEMEKLENNLRYSPLDDLNRVGEVLNLEGFELGDIDQFVVDGWWESNLNYPHVKTFDNGRPKTLRVAPYVESPDNPDPLSRYHFSDHDFCGETKGYASYHHVSGHLVGAYCSSPFAELREDALVLVWDGGIVPHLYEVKALGLSCKPLGDINQIFGNIFADFCSYFGPFRNQTLRHESEEYLMHHLSIAGKAMAYAALGEATESRLRRLGEMISDYENHSRDIAFVLGELISEDVSTFDETASDADVVASLQECIGRILTQSLIESTVRLDLDSLPNLILSGGCALNIKWNSKIRDCGRFANVWIPPFPNDSGSAIGVACCEMLRSSGGPDLKWNVFAGPQLLPSPAPPGWKSEDCSEKEIARILHVEDTPIVVLTGRAEVGPRALGNRSILAPAISASMKDRLNRIKNRDSYRPVAPICLESRSTEVFKPGGADKYMVFEHSIDKDWIERVPAITHLDGTARLQVIRDDSESPSARILCEYERLSGVPLLCNTSANLDGRGFFPDVETAARWGRTKYVWSDGTLYTNPKHDEM